MPRRLDPPTPQRLLDAATRLFYANGFHVGTDRIVSEAGSSAAGLTRAYGGKHGLMVEAVRHWGKDWRAELARRLDAYQPGQARLLGLFDELALWLDATGYRGPLYRAAAAEFPNDEQIRQRAQAEHEALHALVADLARATDQTHPDELIQDLHVLVDGAIEGAVLLRSHAPVRRARQLAQWLLTNQRPTPN